MTVRVPVFPLGSVLLPGEFLTLHVFEPRYRHLVERTLALEVPAGGGPGGPPGPPAPGEGRPVVRPGARADAFGVVLIERGSEVGGGDARFGSGTLARVVTAARSDDGRYALVVRGGDRFTVVRWLPDDPHPWAEVEMVAEALGADVYEARRTARAALRRLARLSAEAGMEPQRWNLPGILDPVGASFTAAACLPVGPLDRQRLLDAPDATARFTLVAALASDVADLLALRGQEG